MYFTLDEWTKFLVVQDATLGIAMALAGVILMGFGRRMSSLLVTANYAALGAGVGWFIGGWLQMPPLVWLGFVGMTGWLAGRACWRSYRGFGVAGVAIVGTLAVGVLASLCGTDTRLIPYVQLITFIGIIALGSVMVDEAIMFLTSAEGGFVFLSGAMIVVYSDATLFRHFWDLMSHDRIFLVFSVVCLTLTGFFLQLAERQQEPHHGSS